ncbi:MarR family winged helix-turn-helix transcriptional regulator [Kordiimonas gwangyangensis]|uniref:MarR family winged helix-turn-helix transcriptional regulator n=1 Tax=Kordiimonas gwangyangensis TaxID=288022 RepID=UPI000376487B|nr:MarR family transcriptional regulator [Kordiimonas gwangyangensis]
MTDNRKSLDLTLYDAVQTTRPLIRNIVAAVDATLKGTGVTVGVRAVLEVLFAADNASLPEVTKHLNLTRQFAHRMLGEAADAGFVERKPSPTRKGAHVYRLTNKGREAIKAIRAQEQEYLRAFMKGHSEEDLRAFCRVQSALNRFFEDLPARTTTAKENQK